jgi:hypothetical protein
MPFDGIASPEQLKILTDTLDAYCQRQGIEPFTQAHEDAAAMVMCLFKSGIVTAEEIDATLHKHSRQAA